MNVKNLKKGFTLTELIIVIVIIGILVGILVPTFVSVIRKANKSADLSLVRNLNDSLALDGIENGRHNNMSEAVEAAKQYGFDIEKISSKVSKNAILWDSKNDVFCYLDEDNIEYYPDSIPKKDQLEAGDYNLWIISDKPHASYSTYYIGNKESETVRNVGFDAGNSEIKDIKYVGTEGRSVVIRTNGGTLSVNAPNDVVRHYGDAKLIDVQNVSTSSYYEYGKVSTIRIAKGRIVITGNAEINVIKAIATNNIFTDIKIALIGSAVLPIISRDEIDIDSSTSDGTYTRLVLEVQRLPKEGAEPTLSQTRYVWASITVEGGVITEKTIKVANSKTSLTEGTIVSDPTISNSVASTKKVSTASELKSAIQAKEKYILFTNDIETTDITEIDYSVVIDGDGHKLTSTTGNSTTSSKTIDLVESDIEVYIIDLTTIETEDTKYGRGIQVSNSGIKLVIDSCEVNAMHYAINFTGGLASEGSNNCVVTINNSQINGWGALNIWSHGLVLNAYDSTFEGFNDKPYNNIGWNDFGTIVLEGDTTLSTTRHAEDCVLNFYNCTISSIASTGNLQSPVLYNLYSRGNTVKFVDCIFSYSKPNLFCTNDGDRNKLFINGKEALIGADSFTFDTTNLSISSDGVTATGTIVVTYESITLIFDLSTVTGVGWETGGKVGTDYIFENIELEGNYYNFVFDIYSGHENGWMLNLRSDTIQ